MTSKQRVFSSQHTYTYNDYIKLKSGNETLKSIKYNTSKNINKFHSYEEYIRLSQSFFFTKYANKLNTCSTIYTTNLYNANISYNLYNEINNEINNECKKTVIYPHAIHKGNIEPKIYFPGPINLDLWCMQNKCLPIELYNQSNLSNQSNQSNKNITDTHIGNKCKTGLCKNATALFI